MEEIYSDECQPGIKYLYLNSIISSSYAHNLDYVWKPLYKLVKGSEKVVLSQGVQ